MNKKLLAVAIAAAMATPLAANADVQIYGKVHMSVDAFQDARTAGSDDSGVGISSNSSRLGFKGSEKLGNGLSFIWQYESSIDLDDSSGTGETELGGRNSYGGFKGGFGKLIFGHHDSPMKMALTKWDPFNETVGEGRTIFGQPAQTNVTKTYTSSVTTPVGVFTDTDTATGPTATDFNRRLQNVAMYTTPNWNGLELMAAYSTMDGSDGDRPDDNNKDTWSVAANYKNGPIDLWAAYEDQGGPSADGFRLSGSYKLGSFKIGAFFESLSADSVTYVPTFTYTTPIGPVADSAAADTLANTIDRDAWGLYGAYAFGNNTLKVAWYAADDAGDQSDSGADLWSVGLDHKFSKTTKVYVMYSALNNDDYASFRLGRRGHGDAIEGASDGSISTPYGTSAQGGTVSVSSSAKADPSAFSVGFIHKF